VAFYETYVVELNNLSNKVTKPDSTYNEQTESVDLNSFFSAIDVDENEVVLCMRVLCDNKSKKYVELRVHPLLLIMSGS
jgi:hypothetical protein